MTSQPQAPQRWAVVGGGILGMVLAHRLSRAGGVVTIFEGAPHLGGLADAWRLGDVTWDRHYHVTLPSDSRLRALLAELGLEEEIVWVPSRSCLHSGGSIHPFSSAADLLRLPTLRLLDRLRFGSTVAYAASIRNGRRLEALPVADWLIRWSGQRTFDSLWLPMLRAKLGESYRRTSAAFIWTIIRRLWSARGGGRSNERFGYVPGGYARTVGRFADVLDDEGVEVELGCLVEGVHPNDGGLSVRLGSGEERQVDSVVVTVAPPLAAALCPSLSSDELISLRRIEYAGIVCASLLLERPLSDYYLTYLAEDAPFSAIVEMSALVDPRELDGHALVYLPRYLAPGDPFLAAPDEEVRTVFLEGLARVHPTFEPDQVRAFRVSRVREVFAIPTLRYSEHLPPMSTSVSGLHLVNSSQIVNGTLNVNETIELAERAAAQLVHHLGMVRQ